MPLMQPGSPYAFSDFSRVGRANWTIFIKDLHAFRNILEEGNANPLGEMKQQFANCGCDQFKHPFKDARDQQSVHFICRAGSAVTPLTWSQRSICIALWPSD